MALAGAIEVLEDKRSRAHVQRRGEGGRKEHIYGPRRGEKRKAEEDLEALRAVVARVADPAQAWGAMASEARALQERADFEARVSVRVAGLACGEESSPPWLGGMNDDSLDMEDSQPYDDSQDYYGDVNELWQEIDEEGRLPDWEQPPPVYLS